MEKPKFTFGKLIKILILVIFICFALLMGAIGGISVNIARSAPEVNPKSINTLLNENSVIVDSKGEVLEKIQTEEFRTIISVKEMPKALQDAFVSVEDERFYTHIGIDPIGIGTSILENVRAGGIVRGASTITQQLARNLYLTGDQTLERKIREAYLAVQLNATLSKEQVLEAYLNRIYLGQGAYGVEAAAQTYFSKSAKDLTLGECAALAATVKSPTEFALYKLYRPDEMDQIEDQKSVGEVNEYGEKFIAVYNPVPESRRVYVLDKMLELGKISQAEHDAAAKENIAEALRPQRKRIENLTTYYTDLVKTQVVAKLIEKGYSEKDAEHLLYNGGLRIEAAIDVDMQRELENVFANFTEVLRDTAGGNIPFINWSSDGAGNLTDQDGKILFYAAENLFDENGSLVIEPEHFSFQGDLTITSPKVKVYSNLSTEVASYYTTNEQNNLVTHRPGGLAVDAGMIDMTGDALVIKKQFLDEHKDFAVTDDAGRLLISDKYFNADEKGSVQPQSAAVVIDYHTGEIKALMGGRDQEGFRIFNRATAPRQPGSTMKPLATFTAALDNGWTAATPVDDVPFYNAKGELWPQNWYGGYRGIMTVREILRMSSNVCTVRSLDKVGIEKSLEYLRRYHIISENPADDDFVEKTEDPAVNDENLAALGLGAMTQGVSPLRVAAAYGAIANDGVYKEPLTFTRVLDSNGDVLLDRPQKETTVVNPQIAYVLNSILQTVAKDGTAGLAYLGDMDIAGKTGTTEDTSDVWYMGFTPYYVTGVWIGCDNARIHLVPNSNLTAITLWRNIMERAQAGLEPRKFAEPEGMVHLAVDTQSGKLPSALSYADPRGTVKEEIFAPGTEPKEQDDVHVELEVDELLNKLAGPDTPSIFKTKKVFVRFYDDYDPAKNNGIVPGDWEYRAVPTETAGPADYKDLDISLLEILKKYGGDFNEYIESLTGRKRHTSPTDHEPVPGH